MDLSELQARLVTAPTPTGKLITIFGPSGIGKTSTFCQANKCVLVECKDNSSSVLKESGAIKSDLPVITTNGWEDALSVIRALKDAGFKNVVIDGGTGLNDWSDSYVIEKECEGSRSKFDAFGRGDKLARLYWFELMEALEDLRQSGVWIFFICHSATVTVKNPSGDDYIRSVPHLSKEKLAAVIKFSDACLFFDFVIAQKQVNKESHVGKAVGGEQRVIRTQPSAGYEAKNRMNLADPIMLGGSPKEAFGAFVEAVKAGKKQAA